MKVPVISLNKLEKQSRLLYTTMTNLTQFHGSIERYAEYLSVNIAKLEATVQSQETVNNDIFDALLWQIDLRDFLNTYVSYSTHENNGGDIRQTSGS